MNFVGTMTPNVLHEALYLMVREIVLLGTGMRRHYLLKYFAP
jgi:hypothetical protein